MIASNEEQEIDRVPQRKVLWECFRWAVECVGYSETDNFQKPLCHRRAAHRASTAARSVWSSLIIFIELLLQFGQIMVFWSQPQHLSGRHRNTCQCVRGSCRCFSRWRSN